MNTKQGAEPASRDNDGGRRITLRQLEEMLLDDTIPDEEFQQYLKIDPDRSRPFNPSVEIDREKVELDEPEAFLVEGAFAFDWANRIARMRRQRRFKRRLRSDSHLPVIVAEGDSWFQFPFFLRDVVDHISGNYNVWCTSAAGDTLANMIHADPEYLDALKHPDPLPQIFLFSGGGNDFIGEDADRVPVLARVLREFEPERPAVWYLDTDLFAEHLDFIGQSYDALLTTIAREFGTSVKVVLHGYDHAIPYVGKQDPRTPVYAAQDKWLGRPLTDKGITDNALRREIVKLMIDRLNDLQIRLCGGNHAGGKFAHAYHVDVRGMLSSLTDWADELHPTSAGFRRIADRFDGVIRQALR